MLHKAKRNKKEHTKIFLYIIKSFRVMCITYHNRSICSLWKAQTKNVKISISLKIYLLLRFSSYLLQIFRKCSFYHLEKSYCRNLKKNKILSPKITFFQKTSFFYIFLNSYNTIFLNDERNIS